MLKKSLSQHLIKDKNIINKMVKMSRIGEEDVVVEVGAGHGDLTRCLIEKAGYVYAIELDRTFRQYLEPLEKEHKNIRVIFGDFLEIPFLQFKKGKKIKVIGNIPYKITGPILFKILEERVAVDSAFLTMQKEIGQRIVSKPFSRTYGALSAIYQIFSEVRILFYMKPGVFLPPPKIDSAFLSITFKEDEGKTEDRLIEFIRICFQNKRKYMKYTLTRHFGEERIASLYTSMGFPHTIRAEEIEPQRFKEIYRFLN
ncbi:MAG: 16S rRNA (adenine(1518)-N(6)/adenine(1519)-N(6))-dimethyltransferase RsmA [Proteobacteria bacterium]|nr:16S rRNA (adenine(1518)-N(6)/adenine(1519)-N(6))-dimethyltransferase RsmA [Pseudomonadota bacterium]